MLMINVNWSDIISGILSGAVVSIITVMITYFKRLPPKLTIADELSYYDNIYRIKILNEINYPIAIISSQFILSYRKDSIDEKNDNYRYKLPIPGETIPYIPQMEYDKIKGHRNEKTYATLVINAQQIDARTIINKKGA